MHNAVNGGQQSMAQKIMNNPMAQVGNHRKGGRNHGDAPGILTPFQGDRLPPLPTVPGQRQSRSKRRTGWAGRCLGRSGQNPLRFNTVFSNDHLGDEAHENPKDAHETALEICEDLCHHYHQWCLAIEVRAPRAAGRGQHHPPECALVTDQTSFEDAGGLMHDPRWGGRQHFYDDQHVYYTYCGGAGCHFSRGADWEGGKPNEEAGYKCLPAIGFKKYEALPEGYLPGYHKKGGPQRKVRPKTDVNTRAHSDRHTPVAHPKKEPAANEQEESIDELRKMKEALDAKLARLEEHMENRETGREREAKVDEP